MKYQFSTRRMKRVREAHRIFQREVADEIGMSVSSVEKWESGERRMRIDQFVDYAQSINEHPAALLGKCLTAEGEIP